MSMVLNMMSTPIKGGGHDCQPPLIANPDEFEFACNCKKCQSKYLKWREQYQTEQREMREQMEIRKNLKARNQGEACD
jgi:hypothetical protein